MTPLGALAGDRLAEARADHDSVVSLARELVRIPSRGGIDSYEPVLDRMAGWLAGQGLVRVVSPAHVRPGCERLAARAGGV